MLEEHVLRQDNFTFALVLQFDQYSQESDHFRGSTLDLGKSRSTSR